MKYLFFLLVTVNIFGSLDEAQCSSATHVVMSGSSNILLDTMPSCSKNEVVQSERNGKNNTILFTSDCDLCDKLIQFIRNEKKKMRIAIFAFSDGSIAQECVDAHKRGVDIEVVVDPSCISGRYNKIDQLHAAGIPIFVYKGQGIQSNVPGTMHHKFAIFDTAGELGEAMVWTGSFNFTKTASERNHENVILLREFSAIQGYKKEFEKVREKSYRLTKISEVKQIKKTEDAISQKNKEFQENASLLRFPLSSPIC